jgi:hypothetical protein
MVTIVPTVQHNEMPAYEVHWAQRLYKDVFGWICKMVDSENPESGY